jgi:hypothetical protein
MAYKTLKDAHGRTVGKYDPKRQILEVKVKGLVSTFDLQKLHDEERKPTR